MKSTVEEIRARFDADVERFSNLETGHAAAVDGALALDLITEAAAACTPNAKSLLDVGCGAGNFTLRMLERLPGLAVTLVDLSQPMLDRASQRIHERHPEIVPTAIQADIRDLDLPEGGFDIVLAAAVLHHLRSDDQWHAVFQKLWRAIRPGGGLWIFDMVSSTLPAIEALQRRRYGNYLTSLKDEAYRDHVLQYIDKEDSPKPLVFQLESLKLAGFAKIEVLHANTGFAAFGAIK